MPTVADAARRVPHSGIREIVHHVLDRADEDIVRLEIGEPGYDPAPHIVEAAREAAATSRYTPSAGIRPLRAAIAERLRRVHDLRVPPEQVVVTQGAVQACAVVFAALLRPGDEVLIPDPAWPNYAMLVTLLGGRPVGYPLRSDADFQPDPEEIASLVTDRTTVLVTNTPSNPTGTLMPPATVAALADLVADHDLVMLADEVYDELIFDGRPARFLAHDRERVVGVYSFSKTYAMTGFRVGYAAAPPWLAPTLEKLQEPMLSCISSASQAAALAALTGPQGAVATMRDGYAARAAAAVRQLADGGVPTAVPRGAFYLMVALADGVDSRAAALDLLDAGVSVAPGTAFGRVAGDHVRLSLAAPEPVLAEGIRRLLAWLDATDGGTASWPDRRGASAGLGTHP